VLSILAWWSIPIGAVILTAAVSALVNRVRRPSDDDTIFAYRRFREAIEDYLEREGASVDAYAQEIQAHVPYKRTTADEDTA